MTRYLLDTNHAGTLLRDEKAPLWNRLGTLTRAECALCRPVVGELWYMIFNSSRVDANRRKLEALLAQFDVWEFDAAAAVEFGRIRAELRRAGRLIPIFDILIAAIARSSGLVLVTADAHFLAVSGLATDNWLGSMP
jgi:tRNA(fMet)-specific endonuclease VapC